MEVLIGNEHEQHWIQTNTLDLVLIEGWEIKEVKKEPQPQIDEINEKLEKIFEMLEPNNLSDKLKKLWLSEAVVVKNE